MNFNQLKIEILCLLSKKYAAVYAEKTKIRKQMRGLKKNMTAEEKLDAGNAVFRTIESLPEFKTAQVILTYWAMPDELPTQQAIERWSESKTILLPSIDGNKLVLKQFSSKGKMLQKNLGIWEPDLQETYEGKVDMVIVPGVAFDTQKNRLGRGKGYYDRFFKRYKPFRIGVGYSFQLLKSVPVSSHDVHMDLVVTPGSIIE